jgi:arylsulfatase A-like enzyme
MRLVFVLLGLSAVLLCVGCGKPEPETPARYTAWGEYTAPVELAANPPNLIVLVIDSLRADAIRYEGAAGDLGSGPMPSLTRLAKGGVLFTDAAASAPWTLPSMTSLLTGKLPSQHGLVRSTPGARLLPDITTFAEVLRETAGYDTVAFVSAGPWLDRHGISNLQGFHTVGHGFSLQAFDPEFEGWNLIRSKKQPFFMLLHSYDVHMPYGRANHPHPHREPRGGKLNAAQALAMTPRDVYRTLALDYDAVADLTEHLGSEVLQTSLRYGYDGWRAEPDLELQKDLLDAYWDGVTWTDKLLHAALRGLRQRGLLDNTLLVITSDHGETFGEHGTLGHGLQLHDELVRVPLAMKGPPPFDRPQMVHEPVALLDVLPTFLDLVGLPALSGGEGRSMLPVLRDHAPGRAVISEEWLDYGNTGTGVNASLASARSPGWKYVVQFDRNTGAIGEHAYDLLLDPHEMEDLQAGGGLLQSVDFDPAACRAVERIRDLIWGRVDAPPLHRRSLSVPYASGASMPRTTRPRPCDLD